MMNIRRTFGTFPFVVAISLLGIAASRFAIITASTAFAQQQHFTAKLSGTNEVPPITSKSSGIATFELNAAGTQMKYTLNVTNIDSVLAAHIHMGKSTENGPVVVNLFIPSKATGKVNGTLVQSSINSTSPLLLGPMVGKHMTDLIYLLKTGQAYVNVHTSQNPPGEVRGQILSGNET
ncbi:MAG: CHRD domain-containing protein [Thermoproteota archaeon]|nr:CHRD domain-containing protein [Thermoproteota archaeon]